MSAFLVSSAHLDALVAAASDLAPMLTHILSEDSPPSRIGNILARANHESVACRYGETEEHVPAYVYRRPSRHVRGLALVKACDCYMYQASEHPGWKRSLARKLVEAIREHTIRDLPGYDAAPWGLYESDVHGAAQTAEQSR